MAGLAIALESPARFQLDRSIRLNRPPPSTDVGDMSNYDLICIGCGPAGETAAVTAGIAGRRVLVVEAAGRPGGGAVQAGALRA